MRWTGGRAPAERLLQQRPPLAEGLAAQVALAEGQQVEGHERRRGGLGQHLRPGRGRVDALEQGVEVEARGPTITISPSTTHASGRAPAQRLDQLGEVAGERPLVAAAQLDLVAVAEHDAAESVPLRLVDEAVGPGQLAGQLGQHGRDRGHDGEIHRPTLPQRTHKLLPRTGGAPRRGR